MFQLSYPTIMNENVMKTIHSTARSNRSALVGVAGAFSSYDSTCLDDEEDDIASMSNPNYADTRTSHYQNNVGQSMPMTLVETISFSTSDFTDNFLTCPTCLTNFDEFARLPRLLPCSHTVCRECLERIAFSGYGITDAEHCTAIAAETIRCPVCREAILMPRGGLDQLPPSYLVNRLMDLVKSKKMRDYIPKCIVHSVQSLFFCETCDCVFCPICEDCHHPSAPNGSFSDTRVRALGPSPGRPTRCDPGGSLLETNAAMSFHEHIVVPFSVAIKRVSEIVNYKCGQCTRLLDNAVTAIRQEMERLDCSVQSASETLERSFNEVLERIEQRKLELKESLDRLREQKMQSLAEQLEIVQADRMRLEFINMKLLRKPDIRKLTDQIQSLNAQVEAGQLLAEPRENSFIKFEYRHNDSQADLARAIEQFGRIKVSNTYPPLCTARVNGSVANVRCSVYVTAMDYNGNVQNVGGDPLTVSVADPNGKPIDYQMEDTLGGSYNISFLPHCPGRYNIDVKIFNRPIRGSPLCVNISEHNNPIWIADDGHSIAGPIDVLILGDSKHILTLDCDRSQISVHCVDMGSHLDVLCSKPHITSTTTSFCQIEEGLLCVADWRHRRLQLIAFCPEDLEQNTTAKRNKGEDRTGVVVQELHHNCKDLVEPVRICFAPTVEKASSLQSDRKNQLGCLIVMDSGLDQLAFIDIIDGRPGNSSGEGPRDRLNAKVSHIRGRFRTSVKLPCSMRSLALSPTGDAVVMCALDSRLYMCRLAASVQPSLVQRIHSPLRGCYTAMHFDRDSRLLVARCRLRSTPHCVIEVYEKTERLIPEDGVSSPAPPRLRHCIDSFANLLGRPYSLATDGKGHLYCADYATRSVRKYRYV